MPPLALSLYGVERPGVTRAIRGGLFVATFCAVSGLSAQAVAGVGDDAIPVPRAGLRYVISGVWNDYNQVFSPASNGGGNRRMPLLGALAMQDAGVTLLPELGVTQDRLRTLTGQSDYAVSLGRLDASGEVRQSIAPFEIEYGATSRLSIRLVMPYVESRDVTQLLLNRTGTGANIGLNPVRQAGMMSGVAAENASVAGQLDEARSALSAEISRCADAAAADCEIIRANITGAQSLITRTRAFRDAMVHVYGTTESSGGRFVPLVGSAAQVGVAASIEALRTDFGKYGITAIAQGAQPAAATVSLGPGGMPLIGTDSSFDVGYQRLGNTRRAGIGDIDLTASFLLYDTFDADQAKRIAASTRGLRSIVSGGWRFGTAAADRTEDAFDVPIGEGVNAMLVRSTTDLVMSRRFWMSASVRAAIPMSDRVAVALPFRTLATTFDAPVEIGSATRSLGIRAELELAPRLSLGDFFGLSGAYVLSRWGKDTYNAGNDDSSVPGMSKMVIPARSLHAAAVGVTFSTLASYVRRRSRLATEVTYTHTLPITASEGTVPATFTDRLELRIYTGFPRR